MREWLADLCEGDGEVGVWMFEWHETAWSLYLRNDNVIFDTESTALS